MIWKNRVTDVKHVVFFGNNSAIIWISKTQEFILSSFIGLLFYSCGHSTFLFSICVIRVIFLSPGFPRNRNINYNSITPAYFNIWKMCLSWKILQTSPFLLHEGNINYFNELWTADKLEYASQIIWYWGHAAKCGKLIHINEIQSKAKILHLKLYHMLAIRLTT